MARHLAIRELGKHPGEASRKALETLLVESAGSSYQRRLAAQSLRASVPEEEACALFRATLEREADVNFEAFLIDMIEDFCD
jgi:hypothetical protein